MRALWSASTADREDLQRALPAAAAMRRRVNNESSIRATHLQCRESQGRRRVCVLLLRQELVERLVGVHVARWHAMCRCSNRQEGEQDAGAAAPPASQSVSDAAACAFERRLSVGMGANSRTTVTASGAVNFVKSPACTVLRCDSGLTACWRVDVVGPC